MTSHAEVLSDSHRSITVLRDQDKKVNTVNKGFPAECNTSIDSGMDESINQQTSEDQGDTDDEMLTIQKKRPKKMVFEEDEDDIGEKDENAQDQSLYDEDDIGEKDDNESAQDQSLNPAASSEKKSKTVLTDTDSSDDDDPKLEFDNLDLDAEEPVAGDDENARDPADLPLPEGDTKDSMTLDDECRDEATPMTLNLKDNDLFDAESDEENRPVEEESDEEDGENQSSDEGQGEQQDEGFDESQLDPSLLARLKKMKGAAKKPKEKEKHHRKAKPTADQMSELYSESQRMLRDSRVNLPYYEPEAKSLDDFLARASQKRKEYSSLRRPKDIQKALIIHERLSVQLPKKSYGRSKKEQVRTEPDDSMATSVPGKSFSGDGITPSAKGNDSGVDYQNIANSQTSTVIIDSSQDDEVFQSGKCTTSKDFNKESNMELPDLEPVQVNDTSLERMKNNSLVADDDDQSVSDTTAIKDKKSSVADTLENDSTTGEGESENKSSVECSLSPENPIDEAEPPPLVRDPSRDLFGSLSTEDRLEDERIQIPITGKDEAANKETKIILSDLELPNLHSQGPTKQDKAGQNVIGLDESNTEDESLSRSAQKDHSKLELLDKLLQQGVSLPITPKLSGSQDSMIMLESDKSSEKSKNAGVLKLMDRLIQHSAKKKPKPAYDVNFSIVEKEGEDGQKKELKLKSVTYHVQEEKEDLPTTASGSKLLILKEQLNKGMKQKREKARLRKEQMYNLENEEGYENKEDNEEEEEEEMTEESDSGEEDDEEDVMDMDNMMEDDGRDYNPLLDTEAREDDEESDDDVIGYNSVEEESNDAPLRLELSEDEEDEGEADQDANSGNESVENVSDEDDNGSGITKIKRTKSYNKSQVLISDSEDEEIKNVMDNRERLVASTIGKDKEDCFIVRDPWRDDFTPSASHIPNNQILRDSSQSPELYGPSTLDESECSSTRLTDNLNDSICSFNPPSQMLDADGYLKITQTQKPRSRIGQLVDATEDDTTALDIFESTGKVTAAKIFGDSNSQAASQDDNMAELMGLCSGKFQTNLDSDDEFNPSQNRKPPKLENYDEDLDLYDPFHVLSNDENSGKNRHKRIRPVLSDSDGAEEAEDQDKDNGLGRTKVGGLLGKSSKRLRREFFEDEAELSGSEFDSDENVDLDEEDDILEEEEGDKDMAGVSTEALRDQVGRVHMKQLQDEDDREVMRFKEMYLQDGDLHGEGGGRIRNFRWKDIDESSQQDMFGQGSDEEAEEEDKDDLKWRKERYEREKFLQESEQVVGDSEGSQLVKFGQLFLKRQDSTSRSDRSQEQPQMSGENKKSSAGQGKMKGSFLARSKEALVKIAHVAKTALGGKSNHSSRNFLFQSIESQNSQDDQDESEPIQNPAESTKRKAHNNVHNVTAIKKPRMLKNDSQEKPTVKRQNSIFNLLNK